MLNIISSIIHTSTNDDNFNPTDYFLNPKEPAQKRYEALRAYFPESLTQKEEEGNTPVFKSNEIFQKSYPIPWLGNKRLRFDLIS